MTDSPKPTRRAILIGSSAAALFCAPAIVRAKSLMPISALPSWRVVSWRMSDGASLSLARGWDKGSVEATFRSWWGKEISASVPTGEWLRLARGFEGPVAFQDVGRIMDFGAGKIAIRRREIDRSVSVPAIARRLGLGDGRIMNSRSVMLDRRVGIVPYGPLAQLMPIGLEQREEERLAAIVPMSRHEALGISEEAMLDNDRKAIERHLRKYPPEVLG